MKRQRFTQDAIKDATVAKINAQASKALVGRTITLVDLHLIPEENGDINHGSPRIMLDDGTVLIAEAVDYGSCTYGVYFRTEKL